jgi:hypothetical protein
MAAKEFPDLQFKMSKKIAQLTKVIYQINSRNEDHQRALVLLTYNHQLELQQVARDAANKIAKFKDLVESRKIAAALETELSKLKKQHEAEKQQAMVDMTAYKKKVAEREKQIQTLVERQYYEIRTMAGRFQERIHAFESTNVELTTALDATRSATAGVSELKQQHESERAEMVALHNERIRRLTAQHAKEQEQVVIDHHREKEKMRNECEKSIALAHHGSSERVQELVRELSQARTQMDQKDEAMEGVRREGERLLLTQRTDYESQLDKINNELLWKKTECDSLVADKAGLAGELAELGRRVRDAETKAGQEVGSAQED